jgi:hypothetical protein
MNTKMASGSRLEVKAHMERILEVASVPGLEELESLRKACLKGFPEALGGYINDDAAFEAHRKSVVRKWRMEAIEMEMCVVEAAANMYCLEHDTTTATFEQARKYLPRTMRVFHTGTDLLNGKFSATTGAELKPTGAAIMALGGELIAYIRKARVEREADVKTRADKRNAALDANHAWASKKPQDWSPMLLTHQISLRDGRIYRGGSAFLIQDRSLTTTHLVTARHVLARAIGLTPPAQWDSIDGLITEWLATPRAEPNNVVRPLTVWKSHNLTDAKHNWLVADVVRKERFPVQPLLARIGKASPGEQIMVVAPVRQGETESQRIYRGKVTTREHEFRFRFTVDPPADLQD